MTPAARLAVRRRARDTLDLHRLGAPCQCDVCTDARAVLLFVPGEVDETDFAIRRSGDAIEVRLSFFGARYAVAPAVAVRLGHALVLAGMEASHGD